MRKISWQKTLSSEVNPLYVSNPYPEIGEEITIKLRVCSAGEIERIFFRMISDGEARIKTMSQTETIEGYDWYSYKFKILQPCVNYHFIVETKDNDYYYANRKEITRSCPTEDNDYVIFAGMHDPFWVKSSVFYQIFPDRFFMASREDAVKTGEYSYDGHDSLQMNWGEKPLPYSSAHCLDFYGGDLDGICEKIPYLKDLGVTCIFVNPIFKAKTTHRYDCEDYFNVDEHLGGNEALAMLSEKLHDNGMRLIVDVSINHTGIEHEWMKAAEKNADSNERSFYYFDENGIPAKWEGVPTLPQLNYSSEDLRGRIYRNENSVIKKFLKPPYSIDGWRFDVGNFTARKNSYQEGNNLFREIRKIIKEINPSAYILGEHWLDAISYLQGDQWDSNMNYYCSARAIRRFLGGRDRFSDPEEKLDVTVKPTSGVDFARQIINNLTRIPNQFSLLQFNLLDSHDIYRLHNFPSIYRKETYMGAVIFLYLLPGAPCIYYGDEIALSGDMTPNEGCRYSMEWDESKWNRSFYDLYKKMNELKKSEECLHSGSFCFLYSDEETVVAARFMANKALIGFFSRNKIAKKIMLDISAITVSEKSSVCDVFSGKTFAVLRGTVEITIDPYFNTLMKHGF